MADVLREDDNTNNNPSETFESGRVSTPLNPTRGMHTADGQGIMVLTPEQSGRVPCGNRHTNNQLQGESGSMRRRSNRKIVPIVALIAMAGMTDITGEMKWVK